MFLFGLIFMWLGCSGLATMGIIHLWRKDLDVTYPDLIFISILGLVGGPITLGAVAVFMAVGYLLKYIPTGVVLKQYD